MGEAQAAGGQVPAAEVTARRFRVASPATWIILLGGLAALSFVAMIPLMLMAHQLFNGLVALVIGVPCAVVGVLVARRQPRNPIGWLFRALAEMITGEQGARKPASPVREETDGKGPGQGHLAGGRLHAGGDLRKRPGGNTSTAPQVYLTTMRTPHDQAVETTGLVSRVEGSR